MDQKTRDRIEAALALLAMGCCFAIAVTKGD